MISFFYLFGMSDFVLVYPVCIMHNSKWVTLVYETGDIDLLHETGFYTLLFWNVSRRYEKVLENQRFQVVILESYWILIGK